MMNSLFDEVYADWLEKQMVEEMNPRRREMLRKGPIAFLSIRDDPGLCKQLTLSFVGKFLSIDVGTGLSWAETETLRYARRVLRPFEPRELAAHLQLSESHTRAILRSLVGKKRLIVASGQQRFRTYKLNLERR